MKVKDIIKNALVLIGREDVLHALNAEDGAQTDENPEIEETQTLPETQEEVIQTKITAEQGDVITTLLYCFNAVEDELARCYFPLIKKEALSSENGFYAFSGFSERPLKILTVKADGKDLKFETDAHGITLKAGNIEVAYRYAPSKKDLEDESGYGAETVSERLIAAGTASEYCLINGEASMAQTWESVYRGEIDRLQRKNVSGLQIPPRRWV